MAKLSKEELERVVNELYRAKEEDQESAVASASGLVRFIRNAGLFALAQKPADIMVWAWEGIKDLVISFFEGV